MKKTLIEKIKSSRLYGLASFGVDRAFVDDNRRKKELEERVQELVDILTKEEK